MGIIGVFFMFLSRNVASVPGLRRFRARLNYAHAYAAMFAHTHAHNLNAHGTGEAWNRGYVICTYVYT